MTEPLTTYETCTIHAFHRPTPVVCHRHHVWPLGMGGPDILDNIVVICPTGHANVHVLLDDMKRNGGQTAYAFRRKFAATEVRLAELGWQRYVKGAM